MHTARALAVSFVFGISAAANAADFTPPADGRPTETQVTRAIAVLKDQMTDAKSAAAAANGTQSSAAGIAIYTRMAKKMDQALTDHQMSREEYDWVTAQISKAWPIAMMQQQWDDSGKPAIEKQIADKQADLKLNQKKLDVNKQAAARGERVMTPEQRSSAVASATTDRDAVAQEVKDDTAALQPIKDEIATHDKEATDADALAKSPPADVSADDKPGYIEQKKTDAQTARDAAKESRDKLAEANKTLADAQSRLKTAQAKVDHPEQTNTDDEKASVKQENDQAIADAKAAIESDQSAIQTLKETLAAGAPDLGGNEKDKPDPQTVALVRKHLKEYSEAIGAPELNQTK